MKNQGISLITLIITIIVIIILAAIVIFTGLGTPDSANFAHFCQDVDNVQSAVLNAFADVKASHATQNHTRTDEQLYIEVATGKDPGQYATMNGAVKPHNADKTTNGEDDEAPTNIVDSKMHCQRIIPKASTQKEYGDKGTKISLKLPLVRESDAAWYVTENGQVFNATGYIYKADNAVYTYYSATARTLDSTDPKDGLPVANYADDVKYDSRAKVIATAIVNNTSIDNIAGVPDDNALVEGDTNR